MAYGGAAARLVVLSGALPERPRVGAGPDHGVLVDVRLWAGGGRERWRGGGASGGVLRGVTGLPVGVVAAPVREAVVGS